jgi:hypothetical protein
MKTTTLLAATMLAFSTLTASATVTLSFNGNLGSGLISNLANSSGVATNGMNWGIVVSTTDAAFAGGGPSVYDSFASANTAGFLSFGGSATDDYYVPGGVTLDTSVLLEGDFTTPGGVGGIANDINNLALANGITAGDKFALVWFGSPGSTTTVGSSYGFFSHAAFVIPSDGQTTATDGGLGDITLAYVGADPIRSANLTLAGAGPVPEPSRMMLLGFGLVGLFFRRRR